MGTVAANQPRTAEGLRAIRPLQLASHTVGILGKINQAGLPVHFVALLGQSPNEEPFGLRLGDEDSGGQLMVLVGQVDFAEPLPVRRHAHAARFVSGSEEPLVANAGVEDLQGAAPDNESFGGGGGGFVAVDDADGDTMTGHPMSGRQTDGPGTHNENGGRRICFHSGIFWVRLFRFALTDHYGAVSVTDTLWGTGSS